MDGDNDFVDDDYALVSCNKKYLKTLLIVPSNVEYFHPADML